MRAQRKSRCVEAAWVAHARLPRGGGGGGGEGNSCVIVFPACRSIKSSEGLFLVPFSTFPKAINCLYTTFFIESKDVSFSLQFSLNQVS